MAKKPTTSAVPQKLEPVAPHDDLPFVTSLAFQQVKTGWVVILLTSQGTMILETEVLSSPLPRTQALEKLRIIFAQKFLIPAMGIKQ